MKLLEKRFLFLFCLLFLICVSIFITRTLITKSATYVDGKMYYTITRSIVKDLDLNFANEYQMFGIKGEKGSNGLTVNIQPPGTSIIWILPFLQTDYLTNSLKSLGLSLGNSGYEIGYQIILGVFNIYLGLAGLLFLYLLLRNYFSAWVSRMAILLILGATNLLYYIAFEPLNSHIPSFFLATIFLYFLVKQKIRTKEALFLGIIAGFASVVRTQDVLLLGLTVLKLLLDKRKQPGLIAIYTTLLVIGFIVGFSPQIYFWKILFDTLWKSPYISYGFNFLRPNFLYVLVNLQNGIFTTTPILFFAFIFLVLYFKKNKLIFGMSLFYFLAELTIVGSYSMYYQFDSYAIRMLITTYPFLSFGLAWFLNFLVKRMEKQKVFLIGIFFIATNVYLIINFIKGFRFI